MLVYWYDWLKIHSTAWEINQKVFNKNTLKKRDKADGFVNIKCKFSIGEQVKFFKYIKTAFKNNI